MKKVIFVAAVLAAFMVSCGPKNTSEVGTVDSTKVDTTKVDTTKVDTVKVDTAKLVIAPIKK